MGTRNQVALSVLNNTFWVQRIPLLKIMQRFFRTSWKLGRASLFEEDAGQLLREVQSDSEDDFRCNSSLLYLGKENSIASRKGLNGGERGIRTLDRAFDPITV
jgi:hypothetical protein